MYFYFFGPFLCCVCYPNHIFHCPSVRYLKIVLLNLVDGLCLTTFGFEDQLKCERCMEETLKKKQLIYNKILKSRFCLRHQYFCIYVLSTSYVYYCGLTRMFKVHIIITRKLDCFYQTSANLWEERALPECGIGCISCHCLHHQM